jgi:hypothetical protein
VAGGSNNPEQGPGAADGGDEAVSFSTEVLSLAETWPRALIAAGWAEGLAEWWLESRARAVAAGGPALASIAFSPALAQALFEARRSRRLVRGLEGAEAALAAQEVGLSQTSAAQTQSGRPRISRLLVVSGDGSPRFYHQVEKLQARFAQRLQVLLIECDEQALGFAIFGGSQRARAVLLDHKEAVLQFLDCLIQDVSADEEHGAFS